jgi:hypothetical protein
VKGQKSRQARREIHCKSTESERRKEERTEENARLTRALHILPLHHPLLLLLLLLLSERMHRAIRILHHLLIVRRHRLRK